MKAIKLIFVVGLLSICQVLAVMIAMSEIRRHHESNQKVKVESFQDYENSSH